jgi:ribosomal protein L11 methyltransferase
MTWNRLTLSLSSQFIEPVEEQLLEAGALSVTLESAQAEELFEPPPGTTPLWQQTQLSSLFDPEIDLRPVIARITGIIHPQTLLKYQIEPIAEQDWQKKCTDAFQPVCFANRLWIYPSWRENPDPNLPSVLLDPGLAFGTGSHPTTALCLDWLAQYLKPGQKVIDYGCGSGILAIAALKLGAKQVFAVDNDPQAIEATLENAKRNAINSAQLTTISSATPDARLASGGADVLVANILANPLIQLAADLVDKVKLGGIILLSGILADQADQVMVAYQPWVSFVPFVRQNEWVRIAGVRER